MDPKKDALWLGNEDYEDLVNEARALCLIFSRVFYLRWESSPQAYWTCPLDADRCEFVELPLLARGRGRSIFSPA